MKKLNKEIATQIAAEFGLPVLPAVVCILRHSNRERKKLKRMVERQTGKLTAKIILDLLTKGWTMEEIGEVFDFNMPLEDKLSEFMWRAGFATKPAYLSSRKLNPPVTSKEKKQKRLRKRGTGS